MDVGNAIPFYVIISIHWPAHFDRETIATFMPIGLQVILLIRMMVFNSTRLHFGMTYSRNYLAR